MEIIFQYPTSKQHSLHEPKQNTHNNRQIFLLSMPFSNQQAQDEQNPSLHCIFFLSSTLPQSGFGLLPLHQCRARTIHTQLHTHLWAETQCAMAAYCCCFWNSSSLSLSASFPNGPIERKKNKRNPTSRVMYIMVLEFELLCCCTVFSLVCILHIDAKAIGTGPALLTPPLHSLFVH